MTNISLTTTTLGINNLVDIPNIVKKLNAKIELSSNCEFSPSVQNIKKFTNKLYIHNYSPKPKNPFVLNLASKREDYFKESMKMVKRNINLSCSLRTSIYSFHAGYASDISPEMLGKEITSDEYSSRDEIYKLFKNRCKKCSNLAKNKGVRLLVENNVLGKKNLMAGKKNLLFLSHIDEIKDFFKDMNDYCGLILDVGHLKVSANSFGFDLESAINYLAPFTEGLHISDNSGEEDTNEYFDSTFWFLPHLNLFSNLKYIAIETKPATKDRIEYMYKLLKSNL